MKYMGSKTRIARYILPIMQSMRGCRTWVEPFCGGCNTLSEVGGKRIGADIHPYLISMWKAVSTGWCPPSVFTEREYNEVRTNKDRYPPELVGYVGFALSYGGKWFGGWRRDVQGVRDYVDEARRNAMTQFPKLLGVDFVCCDYEDLRLPDNCLIYADPPYSGATGYGKCFDKDRFCRWLKSCHEQGHLVFVSEYDMPLDFKCLWEGQISSSLTKNTGAKKGVERLYTL